MSIMGKIGAFIAGPYGALAATAASALLGAKSASDQRKQMMSDQDNQFVRMRNAATKAGFNPLTVLRSGGAQMFGGVPTFSKAGFMQQFVQQGYNAWTTHADNDPLKEYNQKVRDLTLESMKSNIALNKAQVTNLMGKSDPYSGYEGFIPVKVGVNLQYLQIDVAKRLGILPNTPITAGDLEEIKGEIQGGFETAFGSKIGTEVLLNAPILGNNAGIDATEITTTTLPPLGKDNLDQLLEDLAPIIGVKKGRNRPRVRSN